jgi:O-antigen ligase
MDDPVIIAAAAVALTIWGAVVFLRGGLLAGCLAVLLTATVFGYYFYNVPTGLMPLTLDRVLWAVLVVQYVVWRRLGKADPKPLGRDDWLLLAMLGLLTFSTLTHDWWAHANHPAARLILFYLMPAGLYWVARQSQVSPRGVRGVLIFLALLGLYVAATGIAEWQRQRWLVWPQYIVAESNPNFLGRARGPLLNPMGSGILMTVCLASTLAWWPLTTRPGKLLLLALTGIYALGIFGTLTRGAWIGAAAGLCLVVAFRLPRSYRIPALAAGVVAAGVVTAAYWQDMVAFRRDEGASARETAESVYFRPVVARVAWNMFLDRPLLGCGLDQYVDESVYYLHDRTTELNLEKARGYSQHNVFLSLLTETGLVGLGLWLGLLGLWARNAWRLWQAGSAPFWIRQPGLVWLALLAAYVCDGMFHDVSTIVVVQMLLFFLAGLIAGLVRHVEKAAEGEEAALAAIEGPGRA